MKFQHLWVLFGLLFGSAVWAEVTIYGAGIPGLYQKDGKGVYDTVVNKTLVEKGLAKLKVLPPARADSEFSNCQNCCFGPANKNPEFYSFGADVLETEAMNTALVYIFSAPGKPTYSTYGELKGKKVGTRRGMIYGNSFEAAGLTVKVGNKLEQNIKMLESGRLDAMVAYVPDVYLVLAAMGKDTLPHLKTSPVAVHKDNLVCRGVKQEFIDQFNQNLSALSQSGELKNILGDSYVEPL